MQTVFIGIETANAESLAELNKRQNLRIDLVTEVSKFVSAGTMVIAGMIVGFDHDGLDIFENQARFISELPVPLINISPLMAPFATPLYARMRDEGRLIGDGNVMVGNLLVTDIRKMRQSPQASLAMTALKPLTGQVPTTFFSEHMSNYTTRLGMLG